MPKILKLMRHFSNFQTVLPDRSLLIGQKWVKMPKFKSPNETVLVFLNTVSAIYQKYYRFQEFNICTLILNQNGINYYCSSCNLNVDYLAEYWPQYN